MGCLNKCVEEEGIVVHCGENAEDVDGVPIVELGYCVPDEAGDVAGATCGETGVAGVESVLHIEGGACGVPGGEAEVEPGIGGNDWKTRGAVRGRCVVREPDLTCTRSKDDAEGSDVGVLVCGRSGKPGKKLKEKHVHETKHVGEVMILLEDKSNQR
jgi:hypothetical protein